MRERIVGNVVAGRWIALWMLAGVAAAGLGGCSETLPLTQLPDVTRLPQKVLNKDEQQGKVNDMIAKSQSHQTEAAKKIESGR
jgi:hypothetical protein